MNLILFEPNEIDAPLPRLDPRAAHVLGVLRRVEGGTFDAGIVNGPQGKACIAAINPEALTLTFTWLTECPRPIPIALIIGLPRPQTARDILRDATSLGTGALHFVTTDKGEPNYARSTLWSSGEWRRHLRAGAEQAFCTRLPEVSHRQTLTDALATLAPGGTRLALDNYEAACPLGQLAPPAPPVTIAIGPERGWSAAERGQLRAEGFAFVHLGPRVLRTETACIAALTLVRAKLGLM